MFTPWIACLVRSSGRLTWATTDSRSRTFDMAIFTSPGDLFVHHFDLPVLLDGCYLVMKFKDGQGPQIGIEVDLCHVSK